MKILRIILIACIAYLPINVLAQSNNQNNLDVKAISAEAAQGDAKAQLMLGTLYDNGQGVPQNYSEAALWYAKAAAQGVAQAQSLLGLLYDEGNGVPQSYSIANTWFTKAALQGEPEGEFMLGVHYARGQGVQQNYVEAVKWVTMSALQGNALAQNYLAVQYSDGHGVTKSDTQAAYWFSKSAEAGNAMGQYMLGMLYAQGLGVLQNYVEAYKWSILAKAGSNADSSIYKGANDNMTQLASSMTSEQVSQAQQEATNWFQEYQNNSNVEAPTDTSQSTTSSSEVNAHPSQSTNYQNVDYYLQQVLGPNGHIDKALHDKFWQQFNGQSEHDVTLGINWIKGSLLVAQEYEQELWKSALLSYNNHQVIKTERLIQLENEMPEIERKSLPWPSGSSQYTDALASFNSSWSTSVEDAHRLLDAAANHKSFIAVNGAERQIDEQTIEQATLSINASISRLNKLLDRKWNGN